EVNIVEEKDGSTSSSLTARSVVQDYLSQVESLYKAGSINRLNHQTIRFFMTEAQKKNYMSAVRDVLRQRNASVITPDILFEAADMATKKDKSTITARIGLQPGTMNPLHYGHISASLAGIIANDLDMVILANGGTVPDKPYAANADIRNEMARIAAGGEEGLSEWLQVTPIRQQTVEMFESEGEESLRIVGADENARRFNMDMAAFIWLFRANPNVKWTYLVGSDKVAGYGKKGEYGLIVETLGDTRANAQVVYFARTGEDIDYSKDIARHSWMQEKWHAGFFKRSPLPSFEDLSATKVRIALITGADNIDGVALTESIASDVLTYIRNNRTLMFLYDLEISEKNADKLAKETKYSDALSIYNLILAKITNENQVDKQVLDKLQSLVLKKIDKVTQALAQEVFLKPQDKTSSPINERAPPQTTSSSVKSAEELAQFIRSLDLSKFNTIAKFALYSGPPGGGKGAVWNRFIEKYGDLIDRFTLFHTRPIRPGEIQNEAYYFRTPEHLKHLESEGKIITTLVNKQPQGLALVSFKDTYIDPVTKETQTAQVKGLDQVFTGSKIVVLEGGLGWFEELKKNYDDSLLSLFISPFSDEEIARMSQEPLRYIVGLETALRIHSREAEEAKIIKKKAEESINNGCQPEKFFLPTDHKNFIQRTEEAAEQVRRKDEYRKVLVNTWADTLEQFERIISNLREEFAWSIFDNLVREVNIVEEKDGSTRSPLQGENLTSSVFTKDNRLIGAIIRNNHLPESANRFTTMVDPLSINTFFLKAGTKGVKAYHGAVEGENPFGSRPRQEFLFVLKGKIKVSFYTIDNEFVAADNLKAGDGVLFTEGHRVDFLEDTVILEIKQGPYPETKDRDVIILPEQGSSSITMQSTARKTVYAYLAEINGLVRRGLSAEQIKDLRFNMTPEQKEVYLKAINEVLNDMESQVLLEGKKFDKVINPAILFKAAKIATKKDRSSVKARIGLQPGTMNPLHFGHLSMSLAGVIGQILNFVLLANGGTVPDKPYAADANIRNTMANKAVEDVEGLNRWVGVTPIRQQTVDMFSQSQATIKLVGANESIRRFNMDMAAFIWLFMANPKVTWFYLVGSDKVGSKKKDEKGYGEKNEIGLVKETLSVTKEYTGNKTKIVYFVRKGSEIDYKNKIKKYEWLAVLWRRLFRKSKIPSFDDLSATHIRTALSSEDSGFVGDRAVGNTVLSECVPNSVIEYIIDNNPVAPGRQLRFLYPLENKEKDAEKLIKTGDKRSALGIYLSIKDTILQEKALPEIERRASIDTLDSVLKNLDKKISELIFGRFTLQDIIIYSQIEDSFAVEYEGITACPQPGDVPASVHFNITNSSSDSAKQLAVILGMAAAKLTEVVLSSKDQDLINHYNSLFDNPLNRGPPMLFRINNSLSMVSARYYNRGTQISQFIFNSEFISHILLLFQHDQQSALVILAIRLFQELGHTELFSTQYAFYKHEYRLFKYSLRLYQTLVAQGLSLASAYPHSTIKLFQALMRDTSIITDIDALESGAKLLETEAEEVYQNRASGKYVIEDSKKSPTCKARDDRIEKAYRLGDPDFWGDNASKRLQKKSVLNGTFLGFYWQLLMHRVVAQGRESFLFLNQESLGRVPFNQTKNPRVPNLFKADWKRQYPAWNFKRRTSDGVALTIAEDDIRYVQRMHDHPTVEKTFYLSDGKGIYFSTDQQIILEVQRLADVARDEKDPSKKKIAKKAVWQYIV
ncbi:MAG: hypothetical protein KKE64_04860, partial [Candidatus Omnitrophica bacterium]|nr:hypothetical protein [Candidatus Omnitrophota bacterium]